MNILLDIITLQVNNDYTMVLEFENNEKRVFDMKPYLEHKPFEKLKNFSLFEQAHIKYGTVAWPGNIDIDPELLYEYSI